MKRVLVIGNNGSGKSVFSDKLGDITKLPVIHLDKYFHKSDWSRVSDAEWDKILAELLNKDKWIMDGTYIRTLDKRVKKADTVIFLDVSKTTALIGAIKRKLLFKEGERKDLPNVKKESLSPRLIRKLLTFPKETILDKLRNEKVQLVILRRDQIENYLKHLA